MARVRFSYSGDPSTSDKDAVRFEVGDTNERRPLLDDREIKYTLTSQGGNINLAAAKCAEALAAKFASEADIKVGDVSKDFSAISKAYAKLADRLRQDACKLAAPSAPAIRRSTKRALEQNTDLVAPTFRLGLEDDITAIQLNQGVSRLDSFNGFLG